MVGSKGQRIAGWVLSGLLALFLIAGSAPGKFMDFPNKAEIFGKLGFSYELMAKIGVVEIVITILFLIPRTAFLGAILLTAYLGGAVCAHVRVGEAPIFQIIVGVIVWIAYALRRPDIVWPAFKNPPKKEA